MFSSVMILDWLVDPEQTLMLTHGAQQEVITVAARLTGLILNEVVGYTHTF
jgi:hypothetical protein